MARLQGVQMEAKRTGHEGLHTRFACGGPTDGPLAGGSGQVRHRSPQARGTRPCSAASCLTASGCATRCACQDACAQSVSYMSL
jgi:hypothetical protein